MPPPLTHAVRAVELMLRLVYFALAPAALVLLATQMPVAGVVANITFAVVVFAFAPTIRRWVERRPILGMVFGARLKFEEFYRAHPPRSFLYYAGYPLLFPYWLSNPVARQEFLLYRGMTTTGLLILGAGGAWDYARQWAPEIGLVPFARSWATVFVLQALIAVVIAMPLATTIVTLKLQARSGALGALFAVATTSVALATGFAAARRHEWVQRPTGERMILRNQLAPKLSRRLREEALVRAAASMRAGLADEVKVPRGREVLGRPIDDARATLGLLFKEDELPCFHLASFRAKRGAVLVLFGVHEGKWVNTGRPLIWLGLREGGGFVDEPRELPDGALHEMRALARK